MDIANADQISRLAVMRIETTARTERLLRALEESVPARVDVVRSRIDALDSIAARVEKMRLELRAGEAARVVATAGGAADGLLGDARANAAGLATCPDCGAGVPSAYMTGHRALCRAPAAAVAAAAAAARADEGADGYFNYGVEFPARVPVAASTAAAAAAAAVSAAAAAAAPPKTLRQQRLQKKKDKKRADGGAVPGAAAGAAAGPAAVGGFDAGIDEGVFQPPGPPINVSIVSFSTTHSGVTLAWEPPLFDGGAQVRKRA